MRLVYIFSMPSSLGFGEVVICKYFIFLQEFHVKTLASFDLTFGLCAHFITGVCGLAQFECLTLGMDTSVFFILTFLVPLFAFSSSTCLCRNTHQKAPKNTCMTLEMALTNLTWKQRKNLRYFCSIGIIGSHVFCNYR